jgi:hypothetical protein
MTDPNQAQTAATRTAASLSQRLHRLLVVVVTALFGMTLTGVSFAASAPSLPHKSQPTTKPRATPRPSAHANATTPKSKPKAKPTALQHPIQHRKAPTKTRVAAKSKTPTRAHQPPRKPSKLATKQTKHAA